MFSRSKLEKSMKVEINESTTIIVESEVYLFDKCARIEKISKDDPERFHEIRFPWRTTNWNVPRAWIQLAYPQENPWATSMNASMDGFPWMLYRYEYVRATPGGAQMRVSVAGGDPNCNKVRSPKEVAEVVGGCAGPAVSKVTCAAGHSSGLSGGNHDKCFLKAE
ncbi:hypothetical protein SCHPADRAFT_895932 [Schizopora paradoxa]|uniref:Uncharacterized protein n=1 Tax=Schizopora paradoxa TaxID=27342 RepID=A0A0H2R8J2_9AGAM|nr:hypothetical protein SCHPADRAFT_895932 [Schizopora paradoxa]